MLYKDIPVGGIIKWGNDFLLKGENNWYYRFGFNEEGLFILRGMCGGRVKLKVLQEAK
jgi:hypothetical protein